MCDANKVDVRVSDRAHVPDLCDPLSARIDFAAYGSLGVALVSPPFDTSRFTVVRVVEELPDGGADLPAMRLDLDLPDAGCDLRNPVYRTVVTGAYVEFQCPIPPDAGAVVLSNSSDPTTARLMLSESVCTLSRQQLCPE